LKTPILFRFTSWCTEIIWQRVNNVVFRRLLVLAAMLDLVMAGLAKSDIFAPNLTPYRFQKFDPRFLFQPICRLREKWLGSLQRKSSVKIKK